MLRPWSRKIWPEAVSLPASGAVKLREPAVIAYHDLTRMGEVDGRRRQPMSGGRSTGGTERPVAGLRAVQQDGSDEYLTPREAAERLRGPRQRIYEWLKLGRLRGEPNGRW